MRLERVAIPADGVTLAGLLYRPEVDLHKACVVISHGFTASKETVDLLAGYLAGRGYTCLTFDFRGHKLGGSSGELRSMADCETDLRAAAEWGMARLRRSRCVLVGHSMGGLLSFSVAADMPSVAAAGAIATGPKPSRSFQTVVGVAMLRQRADYIAGEEPIVLLEQMDGLAKRIPEIGGRPSLFVAARADVLVKPGKMRDMAETAGSHARFVEIDGTHLEAPNRARGAVAHWLDDVCGHMKGSVTGAGA